MSNATVTVISGKPQVGKTTYAKSLFSDYRYYACDIKKVTEELSSLRETNIILDECKNISLLPISLFNNMNTIVIVTQIYQDKDKPIPYGLVDSYIEIDENRVPQNM